MASVAIYCMKGRSWPAASSDRSIYFEQQTEFTMSLCCVILCRPMEVASKFVAETHTVMRYLVCLLFCRWKT